MTKSLHLSDSLFLRFARIFQERSGIELKAHKKYLVENRLQKLVGEGNRYTSFRDLAEAAEQDLSGKIGLLLVNALTTNYTYFFREPIHFSFLAHFYRLASSADHPLRLWSAACSSGEEAISMAATAVEYAPSSALNDLRILATDISMNALNAAIEGLYSMSQFGNEIGAPFIRRYFTYEAGSGRFRVNQELRRLIAVRRLNLFDEYPFTREFDVIFLRNVLIYFNAPERELIIHKMYRSLRQGGFLVLGLSESIVGLQHPFESLPYSILRKP